MTKKPYCLLTLLVFIFALTTTIVGQEGIEDGLIGYWPMDEAVVGEDEIDTEITETVTADLSDYGNDGTLEGPTLPKWAEGKFGSALYFDGDSNYVHIGDDDLFELGTSDFTVCAWILCPTDVGEDKTIFGKGGDDGDGIRYHSVVVGDNMKIILDDNISKKDPGGEIIVTDSVWHLIVSYRKDLTLRVFVDGVEDMGITNHARSTLEAGYDVSNTEYDAYIGTIASNDPSRTLYKYFVGWIDDVAVFDRALEIDEIEYLWNDGDGNPVFVPEEEPESLDAIEELKKTYNLRNYPNPFSSSTTISFRLPESSDANLKVFNSLGMEVAALVDGIQPAGINKVQFDGSELPDGFYYARFETGSYSQTIKILLTK